MRFLVENYGESQELDNFIYLLNDRFSTYYVVTIKDGGRLSANKYFSFKSAAKEFYDEWLEKAKEDPFNFDGYSISISEVKLEKDIDEFDSETIYDEEEE